MINRPRSFCQFFGPGPSQIFGFVSLTLVFFTPPLSADLLVPAYAHPNFVNPTTMNPDGVEMWDMLIAAAQNNPNLTINVILNPASGPGGAQIDLNYIGTNGMGKLVDFKNASSKTRIFGYVPTTFGARTLLDINNPGNSVEGDINKYYDPNYYRGAGVLVDGIFFDEMSNKLSDLNIPYYQNAGQLVTTIDSNAKTIGNPGTTGLDTNDPNTMAFTATDYANTMDTLVTFEGFGSDYRSGGFYQPPSWLNDFDASHFAHIIHSETLESDMLMDLTLAQSRKAGMVYVTDELFDLNSNPIENPFDKIASYFGTEVSALAIPEPSATAVLLFATAVCGLRRRQIRR